LRSRKAPTRLMFLEEEGGWPEKGGVVQGGDDGGNPNYVTIRGGGGTH